MPKNKQTKKYYSIDVKLLNLLEQLLKRIEKEKRKF